VVLYRLLTGRFPFRLTDEGGVDVEAVLHETPLPPHILNPRVPPEVGAVCLRLLAKTPEERYPSAVALYEALSTLKARANGAWEAPLHGETRPAARKPWTRGARVLAGLGVGLALTLGCWWLTSGQEVAPAGAPPEPAPAPAAASTVAPRKDGDPVKKKQQPSAPPPEASPWDVEALLRGLCLGLGGGALQACLAAHAPVPPERPAPPPPQACPAGAVETMTGTLGLSVGDTTSVEWSDVRGRAIPVREDTPVFVFGNWRTSTRQLALPGKTRLSGRLYFGEGRVYGRFTEARTPTGETYPVCMEIFDEDKVGLRLEPESEPGNPMVVPSTVVRVVDRFQ
jgi:serine/threonine-protein kinase